MSAWLARARLANVARLARLAQQRGFAVTSARAAHGSGTYNGPQAPVGAAAGAVDDPVLHTHYKSGEIEGDVNKHYYYRERPTYNLYWDNFMSQLLGGIFWFWVAYNMYWRHEMLTGHWYVPYLQEFSDEDLGIPPDNAPDPEYWGNHGKKYGTYR